MNSRGEVDTTGMKSGHETVNGGHKWYWIAIEKGKAVQKEVFHEDYNTSHQLVQEALKAEIDKWHSR